MLLNILKQILFSITFVLQNKTKLGLVAIVGMSKAELVKWCLDNSFELIEMISEEEEEDDEEGNKLIVFKVAPYSFYNCMRAEDKSS